MNQPTTPELAYEEGLRLLALVERVNASKLTSPAARGRAVKDIARLGRERNKLPNLKIGIYGVTGAGKSTLVNALLGYFTLPASDYGGACSGAPTLISAHAEKVPDARYKASVTFYSKEYLEDVITTFKKDLEDMDSFTMDERKVAWAKVRALYPRLSGKDIASMSVIDIMETDPDITSHLCKVKVVTEDDPEDFSQKIAKYIESATASGDSALWPMVEKVEIECPSSVLPPGAILVDLPGIEDANPARDLIARKWHSQCEHIFVVADISRAISSKTAQVLLGETFKNQLMLDGKYNSDNITFIATKNDTINSAKPRTLGLGSDSEIQEIELNIRRLEEDALNALRKAEEAAEIAGNYQLSAVGDKRKLVLDPAKSIAKRRKGLETHFPGAEGHSVGSLSDQASSTEWDASLAYFSYNEKALDPTDEDSADEDYFTAERNARNAQRALTISEKQLTEAKVVRWQLCTKKRGEKITLALQQQFREGLASMEDPDSIPMDTNNYDHVNLHVFVVSAQDSLDKFANTCSRNELLANLELEDTGIPALERHIHNLTAPLRQKFVKAFLEQLSGLAKTINMALSEASELPMADRALFREMFHTKVDVCLREGFDKSGDFYVQTSLTRMNDTLGADCRAAAKYAATKAPGISQLFAKVHYNTYRAALRRGGRFREDLNANLTHPFSRNIMQAWRRYFEGDLAEGLEDSIIDVLNESLGHLEGSAPAYLTRHVLALTSKVRSEIDLDIKQLSQYAQNTMGTQRRIASLVESHVEKQMQSAYDRALEENGRGMDGRQKDVVHQHIDDHKETIFDEAADLLVDSLQHTAVRVGVGLKKSSEDLREKIEGRLSSLWEKNYSKKAFHDPELVQARQDMDKIVAEIENLLQTVSQWE